MAPVVAEIALENRNTFAVAKMNVSDADSRQTTGKYQVRTHPTYIVFQDGKFVRSYTGRMTKAQLLKNILSVINIE